MNSLFSQPKSTGESKTKPTQASVKELRGSGLSPDLIVCRSEMPIGEEVKKKISNFCHVRPESVCLNIIAKHKHPSHLNFSPLTGDMHSRLHINLQSAPDA